MMINFKSKKYALIHEDTPRVYGFFIENLETGECSVWSVGGESDLDLKRLIELYNKSEAVFDLASEKYFRREN